MFGISVYLSEDIGEKQRAYIKKAKQHGFGWIFTSLHIPEDNTSALRGRFSQLAKIAQETEMELFADVSPASLEQIGLSIDRAEELTEWGVTGLRVDYGIAAKQIAALSSVMKVALNASTLTEYEYKEILAAGADIHRIEAWHNFYPRPETGLGEAYAGEKNEWLASLGLRTMAFVPGDRDKRGPLFQGLPTLEKHRNSAPFSAALELMRNLHTQKVLIGDPDLSDKAFRQFKRFGENRCIPLGAKSFADTSLYKHTQTNRPDPARDCIRSIESRGFAQTGDKPIEPFHTVERPRGSITVDNRLYLRYAGEMQIVLKDLPADEKVNVIGRIVAEDLPLLPFIEPGGRFIILWEE
ncbi:DUF871 domain-containing protein [Domibacillus robiginosus]|uniref:DUF871 domain-containing protein n=1 Tax=Domibacillus robiginosus TaxID=1071054 RepID=UPI00067B3668|nr:MupG family TIM beta-alpha barrel fold protein [Domibacillus robiginosus]